jgi:hypothetical protein
VSAEILAYQRYAAWAWSALPVSAVIELTAVTIFAANLALTLASRPLGATGGNPVSVPFLRSRV